MLLERFFQVVAKGLEVRVGGPGGNDEAIGKGGRVTEIKELEIHRFFVEKGFARDAEVLSQLRILNGHGGRHGAGEGSRRLCFSR